MAFVLPCLRKIYNGVRNRLQEEHGFTREDCPPIVMFAKDGHYALAEIASVGFEVIGLDWSVDPKLARQIVGSDVTLQVS